MAWLVETLPSNTAARVRFPARSGILISVLELGMCPLPVFCPVLSTAEALALCWLHSQGGPPLCSGPQSVAPPTGIWPMGIWVVSPEDASPTLGRMKNRERKIMPVSYITMISVLPKGRSFTARLQGEKPRLEFCQRQVFHRKLRNQGCSFTKDLICAAVAFRSFSHPTLSLASEQTLKDLERSQGHQRGGEESGFG